MVLDTRTTKYTTAVLAYITLHGHATNAEILKALRLEWPDVSATTIHRVTARLAEHNDIAYAPKDNEGNIRYDANTSSHHHFYCACCDALRDITLDTSILKKLEASLGGCKLNGQLLINGACGKCVLKHTNQKELSHG